MLRRSFVDNVKHEYPFMSEFDVSEAPSIPKFLSFSSQYLNQSGEELYHEIHRTPLQELLGDKSTLLIGDHYFTCDLFWHDFRLREKQIFINKFDNSNSFALFRLRGKVFFMPLGNYLLPLGRSPILKLSVHDVIELTEDMLLQVYDLMLPQEEEAKDFAQS